MKMELIAALLHSPEVLFLDEPTSGLDVIAQHNIQKFLRHYQQLRKITILLTSHYMQDIEELCERVILIDHGKLFFDGPLESVLDRFATTKLLEVEFATKCDADFAKLGRIVEQEGPRIKLEVAREKVANVCRELLSCGTVKDFSVQEIPIEEVIRQVFGAQREQVAASARH